MWGNSPKIKQEKMEHVRYIYVSSANHPIVYNKGKKDDFQVRIIEGDFAYAMNDADYFEVINEYTDGTTREFLKDVVNKLTRRVDILFDDRYNSLEQINTEIQCENLDVVKSVGYNTILLTKIVRNFVAWLKKELKERNIKDTDSKLEEAFVIIFLAMISEWYYISNIKKDTNKRNMSSWQHRVKTIGLYQVIDGRLSPIDASNWSKGKSRQSISKELEKLRLNKMECQLGELSETEYTALKEQCANLFNDKQVMKEYNSWADYISSCKIPPIIF